MTPEKKYYLKNKKKCIARKTAYEKKRRQEGFWVYYLPEEHYVGVTTYMTDRMSGHKRDGNNTEGHRVLYHSDCEMDAYVKEAEFQIILGINGHNEITRINNKKNESM